MAWYLPTYIVWHYTSGLGAGVLTLWSLLRFIYHFFSLPILVTTLFSPWRRLSEAYPRYLRPGEWLSALVVNTLMRMVGALIRLGLIVVGGATLVVAAIISVLLMIIWLLLPAVVLSLLIGGLFLLFN